MKFSLWLEKREVRNQKSQTKMPKKKTKEEIQLKAAGARIHQMAGQGTEKTYGRAGTSASEKDKAQSRARSKRDFNKNLRSGDF